MGFEVKMGEDGILRTRQWGDISDEEAMDYMREIHKYFEPALELVNVFVDGRELGKISSQARRTMASLADHRSAGRVAVLGVSPYVAALITFINKLTGKTNTRFFRDEEKAMAYVQGEDV